jgi:putative hydrolase of the HAD superfamily
MTVIAFDADDTLWVNEPHFQAVEQQFCKMLEEFLPAHTVARELFATELQNMPLYGFGAKAFMLSMVETAIRISDGRIPSNSLFRVLDLGRSLLEHSIELLPGVAEVLENLQPRFRLVVATKGDLLDQERKLRRSGLEKYFHHIEVMSDKQEADFARLIRHLDIPPSEFWMIGNSLKSDILPVLSLGGNAIHIPFHTTWAYEKIDAQIEHPRFRTVDTIVEVLSVLEDHG